MLKTMSHNEKQLLRNIFSDAPVTFIKARQAVCGPVAGSTHMRETTGRSWPCGREWSRVGTRCHLHSGQVSQHSRQITNF